MQKASNLINRVVNPVKSFISEWFNITESTLLNTGIFLNVAMVVFFGILLVSGVLVFA
jgi:hypothetical protein